MVEGTRVLQFGNLHFRIEAESEEAVHLLESMFMPATGRPVDSGNIINIQGEQQQSSEDGQANSIFSRIPEVLNELYSHHRQCIWLDAACLVTPSRQLVLLAGPSCSGKSTLSLAMALACGWKILSEDIVLIEPLRNLVLACPAASGMRPGTLARLQSAGATQIQPFSNADWFFDPRAFAGEPVSAKFDIAFLLRPFSGSDENLSVETVSSSELIRKTLANSNLTRGKQPIEEFAATLANTQCFTVSGGELEERIRLLEQKSQVCR